jgi:ABC-type sugar transport system permease subunit
MEPAAAAAEAQAEAQEVLDHYNANLNVRENPSARKTFHVAVAVVAAGLLWLVGRRLRREYLELRAQSLKVHWAGYALILPQLTLFAVFDLFPIGFALYMSFFQWDMLTPRIFIGLDNYLRVFSDPQFLAAFKRTLVWVVATVPVNTALALGVALLLNAKARGIGFFRLLFYSSSVTSGVALAIIWWWILNGHSGLLNYFLDLTGIQWLIERFTNVEGHIDWLGDERFALLGLIIMDWWRALAAFLIFLAGLQGIPDTIYEAAQIDGANRWQRFKAITWPLLMPATFFVVVTTVIAAFQVFEQVYVMTLGEGGPSDSTTTVNFYLYKNAFNWFRMGYASSVAYVLGAVVLTVTLVQRRFLGREVEY